MLEHIIAKLREDGLYLFKAEEGYRLYDRASQSFRPEAITTMEIARKDLEAVKNENENEN